jgi:hypothetical protein
VVGLVQKALSVRNEIWVQRLFDHLIRPGQQRCRNLDSLMASSTTARLGVSG